ERGDMVEDVEVAEPRQVGGLDDGHAGARHRGVSKTKSVRVSDGHSEPWASPSGCGKFSTRCRPAFSPRRISSTTGTMHSRFGATTNGVRVTAQRATRASAAALARGPSWRQRYQSHPLIESP